jgi:hypothetical protein
VTEAQKRLRKQVIAAAESALFEKGYASPVEVFVRTGRLDPKHIESWRKGRLRYLEAAIQVNLSKISKMMTYFRLWACGRGLNPSETAYLTRTGGPRRDLRFSKSGNPYIERLYRTHYVSPRLREKKLERLRENLGQQDLQA